MSDKRITISNFVEQNTKDLFDFRKRMFSYNSKLMDRERWEWLYKRNPVVSDNTIPIWVLFDKKKIVGSISSIPLRIKIGNIVTICSLGSDYFVHEKYLGLPALRLLKAMQKKYTLNIGANLSPSASKLFNKMGYIDLSHNIKVLTLFFPVNCQDSKSIKTLIKFYVFKGIRLLLAFKNSSFTVSTLVPTSVQLLWEKVEPYLTVSIIKDYNYLQWRYEQCPSVNYRFVVLEKAKKIFAFSVVSVHKDNDGRKIGLISEIIVNPENSSSLFEIIKCSIDYLQSEGCVSCSTELLHEKIVNYFKLMGFNITKSNLGLMALLPKKKDQRLQDLTNPENWAFWIGDTDRY